jgi:type IV pilus assembly protein PilN
MIRINLLPVRAIKAESGRRQDLMIAGASLGLTLTIVLAVYLFQFYRASALDKELAGLRKDIEIFTVQTKEVAELEKKIGELKEKLKAIDQLSGKKTAPVQFMENLSSTVPANLWLTEFREAGGSLTITGLAIDNQTIADFLKALSSSPYFKSVDLVEAVQLEQDGISIKKFTLKSTLSYGLPFQSATTPAGTPPKKEGK